MVVLVFSLYFIDIHNRMDPNNFNLRSNVNVFKPDAPNPCSVSWCVLCRKVLYRAQQIDSWLGQDIFCSPICLDQLWGPPSLIFNRYCELFLSAIQLLGHEADCSHPSTAKVKNLWSYTSIPLTCLHDVHKDI
jgi:hypothetical protein